MPLLAVPQAIGFDVKFLIAHRVPRLPLAWRRGPHLVLCEGIGFPVRFLLSLRVPRPESPPEHKVCLGPKRFTGWRYPTGSGRPSLCGLESLLGCDPRRRHAVRTLGPGPKNPSSMPETPVTRPSLRSDGDFAAGRRTAALDVQRCCRKLNSSVLWVSSLSRQRYRVSFCTRSKSSPSRSPIALRSNHCRCSRHSLPGSINR